MSQDLQSKIDEHEKVLATNKELAQTVHNRMTERGQANQADSDVLQGLMTDTVRRQGAIMQLRLLMGLVGAASESTEIAGGPADAA